jgi:hypothetical protein
VGPVKHADALPLARDRVRRLPALIGVMTLATLSLALGWSAPAYGQAPWWRLDSSATPTNLPPGGEGKIVVTALNLGDAEASGTTTPVTITDKLPAGLTATAVEGQAGPIGFRGALECSTPAGTLSCTFSGALPPYEQLEVQVTVEVGSEAEAHSGEPNEVTIEGGGAPSASLRQPVTISGKQTPFGIEAFQISPEEEGGSADGQAGSHPFQLTSTLLLNRAAEAGSERGSFKPKPPALPKDLHVELPPGLVGNPSPFPQCTDTQFFSTSQFVDECPANTAVGVVSAFVNEPKSLGLVTVAIPLFNLTPGPGEPARFGFDALNVLVVLDTSVRTGNGYGVTVSVDNISQTAAFFSNNVTFWGVPGDPRHDSSRGWGCVAGGFFRIFDPSVPPCSPLEEAQPPAFLRLPTSCSPAPAPVGVNVDSWVQSSVRIEPREPTSLGPMTGCERLSFDPEIEARPEVTQPDAPTGLDFALKLPQESTLTAGGLAEADVKDATVTLPPGMSISPSSADGLQACGDAQFDVSSAEPAGCPPASQIGSVEVITPLLSSPLQGELFVGEPLCGNPAHPNPCEASDAEDGSLFRLFLQARGSGVTVKLPGTVSVNTTTGQLTTSFREDPQLPFSELKLDVKGGPRAPLATPQSCTGFPAGPGGLPLAVTTSDLTPWSTPFTADATPSSSFEVTGCGASLPFAPLFSAGTAIPIGGSFSPFTLTFSRHDGEQDLSGLTVQTPPGLLGMLSEAQLCPEPQASNGTCGPESLIGHTQVAAGAGSHPFWVGGTVFLTGPYKGAPFGLSVVVPALAGPFNLGNVIVRAAIYVDPHDSHLTVISDPLPQIIDGVPLRVQAVNVTIDKPGFMFNPTNCSQLQIAATITAAQGASANVASPFAAAACKNLPFKPGFTVSTSAKTSKANGGSLIVKVTQKPGEANIRKVDLQLPLALPSRLTTLQKACGEAQFAANPAGCPAGSSIGTATAHTPVLQAPLTGPAYLVSHGGAAFPDVEFVLQADERGGDVEIVLDGKTQIKKGVTYSHFETVPDAPISSFETNLPEGPHSALAANGNLCAQSLVLPTTLVGQNGAQVTQSTKVAVIGCKTVTITKRKLSGRSVVLDFFLTAKGAVTVTGNGLRRYRKTLGAGSHQIKVALSKAGLSMRRHHMKIRIKVALRSGAKTSSAATVLKL